MSPRAGTRRRLAGVARAGGLALLIAAAPRASGGMEAAAEVADLSGDVLALRYELTDLSRRAAGIELAQYAETGPQARLDVRLSALELELRQLTGRLEQLSFDVRALNNRIDKVVGDLEFRVGRLEQQLGGAALGQVRAPGGAGGEAPTPGAAGAAPEPSPPSSPSGAGAGEQVLERPGVLGTVPRSRMEGAESGPGAGSAPAPGGLASGTPQQQYAYAFDLLRSSDYERAEQALQSFLARNPDDPLADNARYWLGETFYVRGLYADAARSFADAYQRNTGGPKSADALLKLGMSLAKLDKIDEACASFRELLRTQPDAPAAITNRVAEEQARIGCS